MDGGMPLLMGAVVFVLATVGIEFLWLRVDLIAGQSHKATKGEWHRSVRSTIEFEQVW
jgi:hypothetical protein